MKKKSMFIQQMYIQHTDNLVANLWELGAKGHPEYERGQPLNRAIPERHKRETSPRQYGNLLPGSDKVQKLQSGVRRCIVGTRWNKISSIANTLAILRGTGSTPKTYLTAK
jgi:hypothetical protein